MKEIKFRAWTIEPINDEPRMIYDDEKILVGYHCGIFGDLKHNWRDRIYMQFTGLKDKNGKEIYEGDIVKISEHTFGEIIWHEWGGRFGVRFKENTNNCPSMSVSNSEYQVAGNIYENEGLLDK